MGSDVYKLLANVFTIFARLLGMNSSFNRSLGGGYIPHGLSVGLNNTALFDCIKLYIDLIIFITKDRLMVYPLNRVD